MKFKPLVPPKAPGGVGGGSPRKDDYISSGKFAEELDNVIKRAVADAVLQLTDKIEYDARRIVLSGEEDGTRLTKIYDMLIERKKTARDEWEEMNNG
jgi:hypothetical protein